MKCLGWSWSLKVLFTLPLCGQFGTVVVFLFDRLKDISIYCKRFKFGKSTCLFVQTIVGGTCEYFF